MRTPEVSTVKTNPSLVWLNPDLASDALKLRQTDVISEVAWVCEWGLRMASCTHLNPGAMSMFCEAQIYTTRLEK